MSHIKIAIEQLTQHDKALGEILIEFYETMKQLEKDKHKGGKQATKIVMTINDLRQLIKQTTEELLHNNGTINIPTESPRKVMCRFDDDEPTVICSIDEGGEFNITLKEGSITFTSADRLKSFELFIQ